MSVRASISALRAAAGTCFLVLMLGTTPPALAHEPVSTAFTYQGELAAAGAPATGTFDLRFRLFDAAAGGVQVGSTLCSNDLFIANGRFTVSLDFGAAFTGEKRFLEIQARQDAGQDCAADAGYAALMPRQELAAAPNSSFAQTSAIARTANDAASLNGQSPSFYQNASNLTGTLADARLASNVARLNGNQTFTGMLNFTNAGNTFAGSGAGLTNLNGGSIDAGSLGRASLSADVRRGVGTVAPDLSLLGSAATGTNPGSAAVSGLFAYVVNAASNTLQVFNISDPAQLTLVGTAPTGTRPNGVAVSGSFACVVNYNSNTLQVFNISNPAAPALAGSIITGSGPTSVAVAGPFAYVVNGNSNTLQVFNISNPAAITRAGSVTTGNLPFSIAVSGSLAYVTNYVSNTLQVFNVSDATAPTLAGSVTTGSNPISVAVNASFAYVVNYNSNTLQVFNVNNPASPVLAGSVATESLPWSVAVSGLFAYVTNTGSNTLQVFNINSPDAPTLAGSVATGANPSFVAVSGSLAYVVNGTSNTLQIFSAANRVGFGSPLAASSLAGANGSGLLGVNAASLNGQPASFYTNASNITTGTFAAAQIPNLDAAKITSGSLADTRLSANIPLKNAANAFTSPGVTSFAGNLGIGTITPGSQYSIEAVSGGDSQIALTSGPAVGGAIQPRTWTIQSSSVNSTPTNLNGTFQIIDRTGGASRLLIDTNGNVGIGTSAPTQRLTVAGNMSVTGSLAKGGGSFKIDHPLDPENKYLYHSFVESPDMMNIYNGNITTDASGFATITMPDYFEALNREFRYQVTVIGDDVPDVHFARVFREIKDNMFVIKTTPGNLKVSWQVTGIRHDAWAEKNRIPNSVEKVGPERGKYLHPEAFDQPADKGIHQVSDASEH